MFSVGSFVTAAEMRPVLDMIPANGNIEEYNELRKHGAGPNRIAGQLVLRKMATFMNETRKTYSTNMMRLDRIRVLVADMVDVKYFSLFEIAELILPSSAKQNDRFRPAALYAVHLALYRNDIGFHPLSTSQDSHRRDHIFELSPKAQSDVIDRVVTMVRAHSMSLSGLKEVRADSSPQPSEFPKFLDKAREVVTANRKQRPWTPFGILGPTVGSKTQVVEWSSSSEDILLFLEWWTTHDIFDNSSRYHAIGSLILRALGLYKDTMLDQRTGWTFLQEAGRFQPWEISSRYKIRLPATTVVPGGGLSREIPESLESSRRPDIAAEARRSWGSSPVFCIDGPSTRVIDDGISLERTENPDEFWVHVHTADPSSVIRPNSDLCSYLELVPENIYLPGHFQAMLPEGLGEGDADYKSQDLIAQFSLKSGGPSLTFSAKVNKSGKILDYKVEPGTVGEAVYLDPEDVSKFCEEPPPPPHAVSQHRLEVGVPPTKREVPNRQMVAATDFDASTREELLTLSKLAKAIRGKRLSKGAWPYFFPRASVTVSMHEEPGSEAANPDVTKNPTDPYIKVAHESSSGCELVATCMVLAGQVAARWCAARNIPLPYRRDARSGQNYDAALQYATQNVYPLIASGVEPSIRHRQELGKITGPVELSITPGPYFIMGLDMYTKATSPLRRFGDLLVHWQIHAALEWERQNEETLHNASEETLRHVLPFTTTDLSSTLVLLEMREKMCRTISRGAYQWILIALVRAWQFEKTAPEKFIFTVNAKWRHGVVGNLDLFNLTAVMDILGLDKKALIRDVRVGDAFEVELAEINVVSREISVKALHYLGNSSGGKARLDQSEETSSNQAQSQASTANDRTMANLPVEAALA